LKGLLDLPSSGYRVSGLLVYNLDLLVEYLTGKPVNRPVYPVMVFFLDDESCATVRMS
jgi:hypothetical protein